MSEMIGRLIGYISRSSGISILTFLVIGLLLCDLIIFSTGYIKNLMGCNGNEHCVGVGTRVNDLMDLAETDARA
jgi:hypothetical protein